MSKKNKMRRLVELGKDVLIVLLACSAVLLASRSQLEDPIRSLWREEAQTGAERDPVEERGDMVRPLRMVANLPGGGGLLRCGIQYDTAVSDDLFRQTAGLLVETLSSADAPEEVSRSAWEQALTSAPGLAMDFQGQLPVSVLMGWLGGGEPGPQGVARRMVLTVWQDSVAVYYREEDSGRYYRCISEAANQLQLTQALSALTENGASFAFESELYRELDPDTLILEQTPELTVYDVTNPLAGGRGGLEQLMADLGIPLDTSSFYATGDEQVARNGSDSLRLSDRGTAVYEEGESGAARFPVGSGILFERVEACRRLAAATVGARGGQARLYLISAQETGEGLEVRFGYCLNGAAVQPEMGYAAEFLVENGRISRFELNFRSYTAGSETGVLLPVRQAAAAMEAMGLKGEELLVLYRNDGERAVPTWVAASDGLTEKG